MLNINPVKNFVYPNLISFASRKAKNKLNYHVNPAKSALKPLNTDTVEFSPKVQTQSLNKSLMEAFDNRQTCRTVHENGEPVRKDLEARLENGLGKFVYKEQTNPQGFIQDIVTRVKTPESIREKATTLLAKMIKEEKRAFDPESTEDIKANIGDIVGGRVILRNPSHENTAKIIDKLIDMVNDEKNPLRITRIENYTHKDLGDEYEYFNPKDLDRLAEAVRNKFGVEPENVTNEKNTGYMALHLDVDFSNDNYRSKNDNYKGEIQIVGDDVSRMKDVEDFCYKLKKGMEIRSGNPAYKAFSDYFLRHIKTKEDKDNFETYTRKAYAIQRMKEPAESKKGKKTYSFPTPEECGMTNVSDKLDFNILYKLKELSDKIYDITKE